MSRRRQDGHVDVTEMMDYYGGGVRAGEESLGWAWDERNRELSPKCTRSRAWFEARMDALGAYRWGIIETWP